MTRRSDQLSRRLALAGTVLLIMAPALPAAMAAGLRTETESPARLFRGTAYGVAISTEGSLFPAPVIERVGPDPAPGHPQHVWSIAADDSGNAYLGTGPDGKILKVTPAGVRTVFFDLEEPLVTALAMTRDGYLLAAGSPGGRVYRIASDGTGEVWSETEQRYVWAIAVSPAGEIHASTGEAGRVFRIAPSGSAELLFESDEPHLMSLLAPDENRLLAGSAGRGLLYELDAEGNAMVLHDGELPEVAAIAVEPDGGVLAALVAPPEAAEARPALKLTLPNGTQVASADENVGALEERRGPVIRGTIEGLPGAAAAEELRVRGRVIRIEPSGEVTELWSSHREGAFALLRDDRGRILFGAGEPAKLYAQENGEPVSLLGTLDEAQISALVRAGRSILVATSNPAEAYRLSAARSAPGVFDSPPLDAGGPARWGSIRWRAVGAVEIYTRTGNSSEPDGTWSAWSPVLTDQEGSAVVNPDGRFLQWRARFAGARDTETRITSVTLRYEPYNRAPLVREFRLEGGGDAVAGDASFRWSASDPDLDPVELTLRYRSAGSTKWLPGGRVVSGGGKSARPDPGGNWADGALTWSTSDLPEGPYEVQALASDQAANDPDDGREIVVGPPVRISVDRSPPGVRVRPTGSGSYEIEVVDSFSDVRRLEVIQDGRVLFAPRAVDGVCDSREESFRLTLPAAGGAFTVRGVDAAGNAQEETLPAP